jgi:hypothetical protein
VTALLSACHCFATHVGLLADQLGAADLRRGCGLASG